MFSQRLDFIMNLTNTRTSSLAKVAMIDASYVSKLRTGSRKLPKDPVFLYDMCLYFVSHIKEDYQKKVFCDVFNISDFPEDEKTATMYIHKWLLNEKPDKLGLELLFKKVLSNSGDDYENHVSEMKNVQKVQKYYYGIVGKRDAVIDFFDVILQQKNPTTLYLRSDENMSWMIGDRAYTKVWQEKFRSVLKAGNKVVIIHNVKRNIDEIIRAAAEWSAMYAVGSIKAYYYPRIRDKVYQRTLFIAKDLVALSSISVNNNIDYMLNDLVFDKEALNALRKEFDNMLSLCKPLSVFINKSNVQSLYDIVKNIECKDFNLQSISSLPYLFTMPSEVASSLQERMPNSFIKRARDNMYKSFEKVMSTCSYVCVVQSKETLLKVSKGKVDVPFAYFCNATGLKYTPEEVELHYEHLKYLENKYSNFKVVYVDEVIDEQMLFSLGDIGFLIAKNTGKNVVSMFMEENIVNACREFLERRIEKYM